MADIKQIRLSGFGGQGIVLAGVILGYAGINDKYWVSGSNSYGAQARGSACKAEVVFSSEPIAFPHVIMADILVSMSQGAYDKFISEVAENGVVIYDSTEVKPSKDSTATHYPVYAIRSALEKIGNKQVANMVMLGSLSEITNVVSNTALIKAVEEHTPPRFKELNLKAINLGFELGSKAKRER